MFLHMSESKSEEEKGKNCSQCQITNECLMEFIQKVKHQREHYKDALHKNPESAIDEFNSIFDVFFSNLNGSKLINFETKTDDHNEKKLSVLEVLPTVILTNISDFLDTKYSKKISSSAHSPPGRTAGLFEIEDSDMKLSGFVVFRLLSKNIYRCITRLPRNEPLTWRIGYELSYSKFSSEHNVFRHPKYNRDAIPTLQIVRLFQSYIKEQLKIFNAITRSPLKPVKLIFNRLSKFEGIDKQLLNFLKRIGKHVKTIELPLHIPKIIDPKSMHKLFPNVNNVKLLCELEIDYNPNDHYQYYSYKIIDLFNFSKLHSVDISKCSFKHFGFNLKKENIKTLNIYETTDLNRDFLENFSNLTSLSMSYFPDLNYEHLKTFNKLTYLRIKIYSKHVIESMRRLKERYTVIKELYTIIDSLRQNGCVVETE